MKMLRRLTALLLCLLLLFSLSGGALAAVSPTVFDLGIRVDGRDVIVRAYEDAYPGNYYLSLSDLAARLKGTGKQFRISYDSQSSTYTVSPGKAAGADAVKVGRSRADAGSLALARNKLFVDKSERRYYTFRSGSELYMSTADIQLMLDLSAEWEDGVLCFDTTRPFAPDVPSLCDEGYFDMFNSVLVGDADTGEVLFSVSAGRPVPVASLSKLMTWLLVAEAIESGEIGGNDTVAISDEAARISRSDDGAVRMNAGASYPLEELMGVMLLASSNEAAQALAEHVAGDTASFAARMNERAAQLGLRFTHYYTPSGLPSYSRSGMTGKLQNRMSAVDLFRLCQQILNYHPEITKITSQKLGKFEKLKYETYNSNPLVFNLEGVNGLKTGSTNKAGSCLVASLPVTAGGKTHTVVAVVLGAEQAGVRGQATEMLLRWARDYYTEHGFG